MTLVKKRPAISTIMGGFFFLILMVGSFTAIITVLQSMNEVLTTERQVAQLELQKKREEFTVSSCVDTSNNRLFVEVVNTGSTTVEIADLIIVNKTLASRPATLFDIDVRDTFVPFGNNGTILFNQPLIMDPGDYDIKVVSLMGQVKKANAGLDPSISVPVLDPTTSNLDEPRGVVFGPDYNDDGIGDMYVASQNTDEIVVFDGSVPPAANSGKFLAIFVSAGLGGLDKPKGLVFAPDGQNYGDFNVDTYGDLFVSSHQTDQVLVYQGGEWNATPAAGKNENAGDFIGVFAPPGNLEEPEHLTFGPDANADGKLDLYVASEKDGWAAVYQGDDGTHIQNISGGGLSKPNGIIWGPAGVDHGDWDNDGFPDLFVSDESADIIVAYDGNPASLGAVLGTVVTGNSFDQIEGMTFGPDYNSDGRQDLYASNEKKDNIIVIDAYNGGGYLGTLDCGNDIEDPEDVYFGPDASDPLDGVGEIYVVMEKFDGQAGLADQVLVCDGSNSGGFMITFTSGAVGGPPSDPDFVCP